jgi:hypothetical protein
MPLTMKDILDGVIEEEAQTKLAAVERYYDGDQEAFAMLDEALDLIKEAQEKGEIPELDSSQALSVAVDIVEQERLAKEASAWAEAGETVAFLLNDIGISPEEISKVASEDDADALGRIAARAYAQYITGENFLGLEE